MAQRYGGFAQYHQATDVATVLGAQYQQPGLGQWPPRNWGYWTYTFDFQNFFHPYVGALIRQLNQTDVKGMLNIRLSGQAGRTLTRRRTTRRTRPTTRRSPSRSNRAISMSRIGGPYAGYNWELLYHLPVAVAVHLSNNQRFAEAQKWFHLVFDPTNTDTTIPAPQRFWTSFVFNGAGPVASIQSLLDLLDSTDPAQAAAKQAVISGYDAIMKQPFDPFVVARKRPSAFQWYVVMKYLDNLIAWGDSLFLQDTIETINEATLCYVLAANLLGEQPQTMPQPGRKSARNYLQLKQAGLDAMSNALIDLEAQFPFNLTAGADPVRRRGGHERRAVRHRPRALFLRSAEPDAARLLGHRRRPAVQDPQQREHPGRLPAIAAVRPAARSRHAGQGGGGGYRHRQRGRRPQPAARADALALSGAKGAGTRRRSALARHLPALGDREGRERAIRVAASDPRDRAADAGAERALPAMEARAGGD